MARAAAFLAPCPARLASPLLLGLTSAPARLRVAHAVARRPRAPLLLRAAAAAGAPGNARGAEPPSMPPRAGPEEEQQQPLLRQHQRQKGHHHDHHHFERQPTAGPWDVLRLARPARMTLAVGLFAAFVSAATSLVAPYAVGKVLDAVARPAVTAAGGSLRRLTLWLLGLHFVGAVAKFVEVSMLRVAGERIVCDLREKLFSKFVRSDIAQLATSSPGEMLSRIQRDTGDLQHVLTRDFPQLVTGAIETAIGFVVLFRICAPLARWVTIALPLSVVAAAVYGRVSAKHSRSLNAELAASSDVANEQLTGIRVVKSFAGEGISERKYSSTVRRVLLYGNKVAMADGFMQAWNRAVFSMKNALILWAGSKFVAAGSLSIGTLLAFAFYTGNLSAALSRLGIGGGEIIRCGGSISRVVQILGTAPTIEQEKSGSKGDTEIEPELAHDFDVNGSIAFENVSFAYPAREHVPALRNVSFAVPAGSSVALVGRSGGGKSTVVQLLQRFFDPSSGSVQIDERPLNSFDLSYLRGHLVGVVPQDPVVFTGTIAENISFGKPGGATESEIVTAARDAGVLDFTSRLPRGLDTLVGPSVGGLSGGEKQRVMIARCLIKNPPILLLDEATSALDASSEAMVNATIGRLMADHRRTVVVVTHRLSIARRCDRVIVLDRGTVSEEGSHADLVNNRKSMYSQLLQTQSSPSTL